MHVGRQRAEWNRTALLAELLHNANCKKGQEKSARQFNPYAVTEEAPKPMKVPAKIFLDAMWAARPRH